MDESIVARLVALNQTFYEQFAVPFSTSRNAPQPGYAKLLPFISPLKLVMLDVGCGNGRFGRYLIEQGLDIDYTGIDISTKLMSLGDDFPGRRIKRDISQPGRLAGLGLFDLIVILSTIQHVPAFTNRVRLLNELREHLADGGQIMMANWQFLSSHRQRRKLRPWSEVGLDPAHLEPGDYLLSWDRGGKGVRYAACIDKESTLEMARAAGLSVKAQFFSDGREGDLNLYTILIPFFGSS